LEAQITSSDQCEAICSVEQKSLGKRAFPEAVPMRCQSPRLGALQTPVTLLWPPGKSQKPVLRFGTWLGGYQQTALLVELDRLRR